MNDLYMPFYPLSTEANMDGAPMQMGKDATATPCPDVDVNPEVTPNPDAGIDTRLLSLSMAFVPRQNWEEPYDLAKGFAQGTIFPSLDLPFLGSMMTRKEG